MSRVRILTISLFAALSFSSSPLVAEEAEAPVVEESVDSPSDDSSEVNPLVEKLKELVVKIETEGGSSELLEELGDTYTGLGDMPRAVVSYQRAIEEFGGSEQLYYKLAGVLLVVGRPELGLEILKIGAEQFPDSARLAFELGKAYFAFGKHYASVSALKKACELSPENDSFHYHLAISYRALKKNLLASEVVDRLIENGSEEKLVHLLKGDLLLAAGEGRDAVRLLEDLLEAQPEDEEVKKVLNHAYHIYAFTEASGGRLGRAIRTMEDALEVVPDDPETYTAMGSFHQEAGDLESAEKAYLYVIENHPDFLDIYSLYGSLLQALDRVDDAVAMLEKGLAKSRELKNESFIERYSGFLAGAKANR